MTSGADDSRLGAPGPLERRKELDHAHRNRLGPSRLTGALSLRLLRHQVRSWLSTCERPAPRAVERPHDDDMLVVFVGHATCELVTRGARVLADPWLTDWLAGFRRPVAATLDDADRADVSLVLITHGRPDRMHLRSLARLPSTAAVVCPPGLGALVARCSFADVHELEPGQAMPHGDLSIVAVASRHDGAGVLPGRWRAGQGYVVQGPQVAAYVAGPTGYFSGFADIGQRLRPDVALLPIAGYQPDPLRGGNLSPLDALYAFEDLRARLLVPVGYGALPLGYEPFDEPLAWLRALAAERGHAAALAVLAPGQVLRVRREALRLG